MKQDQFANQDGDPSAVRCLLRTGYAGCTPYEILIGCVYDRPELAIFGIALYKRVVDLCPEWRMKPRKEME